MKKMLYLTTQLPFPPVSGGVIKSWRMVEHFNQECELSVFCFLKGNDSNWVKHFEKRLDLQEFSFLEFEVRRSVKALINSYLRNKTLNLYRNYSSEARSIIKDLAEDKDIIFVDHYEMFQYVPKKFGGRVVLHQHNAEFVLWDRFAALEKSILKKNFLYLESKRIQRAEKEYCQRADLVLASPNDIEKLIGIGIEASKFKTTYHLGEDNLLDEPALDFNSTEKSILFLGTLSWEANVNGLLYFIENVFPRILEAEPDTRFYIVGKNADERLSTATKDHPNILLTGFVDNVEPIYKKSRVFVLPLLFGSGMKVKFLNALYRGIPTVSTEIGAEGLEVKHQEEAFVANDEEEFAFYCLELLRNEEVWKSMQNKGRKLANEKYRWTDHLVDLSSWVFEKELTQ